MTDINEMTNAPVEVELSGKKFKVTRLSIEELFAMLEAEIIGDKIAQVQQVSQALDGEEKLTFLQNATMNLPHGKSLQHMVQERMGTVSGIRRVLFTSLQKEQPDITIGDVQGMLADDEKQNELVALVDWITGSAAKKALAVSDAVE